MQNTNNIHDIVEEIISERKISVRKTKTGMKPTVQIKSKKDKSKSRKQKHKEKSKEIMQESDVYFRSDSIKNLANIFEKYQIGETK